MKKEKKKIVKYQYRVIKETGELILVYVNFNSFKKWYEAYDIYGDNHFEPTKEYLLTKTIPQSNSDYVELTGILKRQKSLESEAEIINRLPYLK